MAGETVKTEALCLDIRPWSQTSHVVNWLTDFGTVATVVKGAERPKGAFLGAYDLNYTCEIIYYARASGELHALRECTPLNRRDALRGCYRTLALAGYFRSLAIQTAPRGPEGRQWLRLLSDALDDLARDAAAFPRDGARLLDRMIDFDLALLDLAGLTPDFSGYDSTAEWSPFSIENAAFTPGCPHPVRIGREVARRLADRDGARVAGEKNMQILLDAARVIGVFYSFHLDCAPDVRRSVLAMISNTTKDANEHG